jgi:hypothetical protein
VLCHLSSEIQFQVLCLFFVYVCFECWQLHGISLMFWAQFGVWEIILIFSFVLIVELHGSYVYFLNSLVNNHMKLKVYYEIWLLTKEFKKTIINMWLFSWCISWCFFSFWLHCDRSKGDAVAFLEAIGKWFIDFFFSNPSRSQLRGIEPWFSLYHVQRQSPQDQLTICGKLKWLNVM